MAASSVFFGNVQGVPLAVADVVAPAAPAFLTTRFRDLAFFLDAFSTGLCASSTTGHPPIWPLLYGQNRPTSGTYTSKVLCDRDRTNDRIARGHALRMGVTP